MTAEKPSHVRGGPPRVTRSSLTETWYVVTAYYDHGGGDIEATQKREVHPDDARDLEALYQGYHAARRAAK